MTELSITSVGYSRLVSLGNYENERVNATARVLDGEDADAVLADLKEWVNERVADVARAREERDRAWQLQGEIGRIESQLADAKRKWENARPILEAHGIKVSEMEDLPF